MESKEILWNKCLEKIEEQVPPESYATWFSPTYPHALVEDCLTLGVPNNFYKKCLQENYRGLIESVLLSLLGKPVRLDFSMDRETLSEEEGSAPVMETEKFEPVAEIELKRPSMNFINPKYDFSNFIVGSSNQFAHAAALSVANKPAHTYNPLFIYGGVGLGKTHLLHAIGNAILKNDSHSRIRYISAESFTVDLIESLKKDDMPSFRDRYRPLDVLFVDDIQFLAGKDRTQEEFFYTFNALYESHKQVVLSSDKYPKDINNIEERLRSRFESGLIADIETPDLETKVAILYKKAEVHNKTIPQDVAIFIASNIKTNIRELEGLLLRIIAYSSFTHREITLSLAQEVLKEFAFDKNKNFTIPIILKTVAAHFNIRVLDLKSKKRSRGISVPRQIAMYLCREYTKHSLPDIGHQFGGKDHTTVIFSYKKISKLVKENNELSESVKEIISLIERGKTP
ncbi:chromosomal replication initiation protein [Candidatus Nitromaritima sp. SCGC AAA799-A02]|nr:chromosomal replication initiation protein [Candidatus Nitromaritima sp. SCGC AAA799-A02]